LKRLFKFALVKSGNQKGSFAFVSIENQKLAIGNRPDPPQLHKNIADFQLAIAD